MATLVSPGVAVSITDESFYGPAGPGTTPLLIVASGEDKAHVSGTGTADCNNLFYPTTCTYC